MAGIRKRVRKSRLNAKHNERLTSTPENIVPNVEDVNSENSVNYEKSASGEVQQKKEKIVVKPQVQAGVDKMLAKGRRYFGSSEASLTHETHGDGESGFGHKVVNIGLDGKRKTTEMLKYWIKDKKNVVLVNSVHLKAKNKGDSKEVSDGKNTDHVLVMGNTVVIVDTKA